MQPTERAALWATLGSLGLVTVKISVGMATSSMGLMADGIHSSMDVLASIVTLMALRIAKAPPDADHRYGHGQFEALAAVIQSLLILLVSWVIIREALERLITGQTIENALPGIFVTILSILAQGLISLHLLRLARRYDSIALRANGYHLATDVITSIGVLVSLIIVEMTGFGLVDSLAAAVVALIIIKTGLSLGREGLTQLLDASIPDHEIKRLHDLILDQDSVKGLHQLRARRSGSEVQIDAHLEVPPQMPVAEVDELLRSTKSQIRQIFPKSTIVLQIEPQKNSQAPGPKGEPGSHPSHILELP